jgi:hypothetical protein
MDYINSFIGTYLTRHKGQEELRENFISDLDKMMNDIVDNRKERVGSLVSNTDFLKKFVNEFYTNHNHLSQANLISLMKCISMEQVLKYILANEYNKAVNIFINVIKP